MSLHITMQEFKDILQETNKPLVDAIVNVQKQVVAVEHKLDSASQKISENIKDNALLENNFKNLKENQDKINGELSKSVNENWTFTRGVAEEFAEFKTSLKGGATGARWFWAILIGIATAINLIIAIYSKVN